MGSGPYLERLLPYDLVYGYQYNRIVDALTNNRQLNSVATLDCYDVCFGYQPVDATFKARCRWNLHTNVDTVINLTLHFTLQPFHVGNQTTAVASTSSGGSAHSHSVSGQTTGGGTTSSDAAHSHLIHTLAGSGANNLQTDGSNILNNSGVNIDLSTTTGIASHSHSIASEGVTGATSSSESSHTHTIPSLSLNAPTAIYEAGMAQGVHVFIDGTDRTGALGGPFGSGSALDVTNLNIAPYITTAGWHEIQLSSTAIGGITTQIQFCGLVNGSIT